MTLPQFCFLELQGHQIKNKDLMVASGAITLKGTEVLDELQEDEQAVSTLISSSMILAHTVTAVPKSTLPNALCTICRKH